MEKINKLHKRKKIDVVDVILFVVLTAWGLIILLPFLNAVAISFASYKEYLETPLLLFPKNPELKSYQQLIEDGRIWIGYRTTIIILIIAVPLTVMVSAAAESPESVGTKLFSDCDGLLAFAEQAASPRSNGIKRNDRKTRLLILPSPKVCRFWQRYPACDRGSLFPG